MLLMNFIYLCFSIIFTLFFNYLTNILRERELVSKTFSVNISKMV